jgi:hypothetical protein
LAWVLNWVGVGAVVGAASGRDASAPIFPHALPTFIGAARDLSVAAARGGSGRGCSCRPPPSPIGSVGHRGVASRNLKASAARNDPEASPLSVSPPFSASLFTPAPAVKSSLSSGAPNTVGLVAESKSTMCSFWSYPVRRVLPATFGSPGAVMPCGKLQSSEPGSSTQSIDRPTRSERSLQREEFSRRHDVWQCHSRAGLPSNVLRKCPRRDYSFGTLDRFARCPCARLRADHFPSI